MTRKYIVAMLAQDPDYFVDFAQANFKGKEREYLLGDNAKPHVTLVQFYGDDSDYHAVFNFLETIKTKPSLRFLGLQFGQDRKEQDIWWANCAVARDSELLNLHAQLVDLLQSRQLEIINEARDLYAPHVTLARYSCDQIACSIPNIPSVNFNLAIGICGEIGQFREVLHEFKLESTPELKPAKPTAAQFY